MKKKGFINDILRLDKTVFSFKDLVLLWGNVDAKTARVRLSYYVKSGALYRIRRGLYAKDERYDKLEMATKIFTPAYISFETVLVKEGVVFQHYERIFVASYQSKELECDGTMVSFRKIKDTILVNKKGLENKGNYYIASTERAYLDTLYLTKDYHFDNLSALDWGKVFKILPIYKNKRMKKRVEKNYKFFKNDKL